ncbi:MAG: Stp1/IreP family PP2C-type Ser/Thr phosphatase [Coriobacteriales bacterium]|jgi:protein phosphatase|nr:Stp1/IreP family PP2C-type Ser/Thr phosphatase [Coriobacteriales bacterium]
MSRRPLSSNRLEIGSATSIGKLRTNNEDAYLAADSLFAVADGMGGHAAGEIASTLAISTLKSAREDLTDPANLKRLVMQANLTVLDAPRQGIGRAGMGTTLTAAVIDNDRLLIAQIGDSRAYLLHENKLRRVTRDHSYIQELLNSGEITEAESRDHPRRGVITRVLGFESDTQPDLYELRLEVGDRLLLCSDGLHGMIEDDEIALAMTEPRTAQQCADALVRAANNAGGQDNTTVVVVDICSIPPPARRLPFRRSLRSGILGFLLAFSILTGSVFGGVWLYASHAAYVITEDGQIVIYRGLVGDVFGLKLQWQHEVTDIKASSLESPLPERLRNGIQLGSLDEAEDLIEQYRQQIDEPKGQQKGLSAPHIEEQYQ